MKKYSFQQIFDHSPTALIIVNKQGGVDLANFTATTMFGYDSSEFANLNLEELLPDRYTEHHPGLRQEYMQDLSPRAMGAGRELYAQRKDGTEFPVEIGLNALESESEVAVLVTLTDITERKQVEEESSRLERKLQQAQKLESLGVLAGGIAHDFNNILMSILGNADLALDVLSPHSPARANIEEIEIASKRAADLVKQMLAYSGKGKFVVEEIKLDEFVREMAHLLEVSISKKTILKYDFADNLPTFNGDATQIRQVIMNLITNASDAIGDKSGVIALSTGVMDCDEAYLEVVGEVAITDVSKQLSPGVYSYFEVSDTGCGMDTETIGKIFDPFYSTKFTGRGLGMSAVLGIVRGHKGAIKIYSEPDKGTSFKVLFPANEIAENGLAMRAENESSAQDWQGSGTVLIADDEKTVRAVGKQMLERMGFNVLTAPDGQVAVELFREHADEIVCVLLDLTMPHLDGEEAFREIRRIHPETRVILCSGYNMQDAKQRFTGKRLTGFVQKPYNMATLREKLKEILDAK